MKKVRRLLSCFLIFIHILANARVLAPMEEISATKAGIQAVAASTVVGTLNHQGNLGKALEDAFKPPSLKSIATAIATAGLVGPTPEGGVFSADFAENLATHGVRHLGYGLQAGAISFAINGGSAKDALKGAGLLAVASAVQASVANELGEARKAGLDSATHKLGHALAGAAAGAILDPKNPGKGAAAGALGAVIGETVAEALPESLTRETRADYGKIAAATGVLLSKQDVPTAIVTADTALQNNFLLSAGELAYEWIEEENPEKAKQLKEISLNILSHVTGESREVLEAALPGIMLANNYLGGGLVKKIAKTTLKKQIKSAAKDALKPNLKVIGKGAPLRGTRNPKVKKSLDEGNQAHARFAQKIEQKKLKNPEWKGSEKLNYPDGRYGFPDAQTAFKRPVELKPLTNSGIAKGIKQLRKYEAAAEKDGILGLYDKQTGQVHYLRSKQLESVGKVKEIIQNRMEGGLK
ncbi:MAG: DUF637 domain-containing protein [Alphaproteobacteria bacterium]